jgi:hypothetical protein
MSERYIDWTYMDLKIEAARRGLGGKGTKHDLINKLVNADLGSAQPDPAPAPPDPKYTGLKATDPNPDNPNYDLAGRWIRRQPQRWVDRAVQKGR